MGWEDTVNVGAGAALNYGATSGNVYVVAAAALWLIGDYIYNYYSSKNDGVAPHPDRTIGLPSTEPGSIVPLFWGTAFVKNPILAWTGTARYDVAGTDATAATVYSYLLDMMFILGSTFTVATTRLLNIYLGGTPMKKFSDTGPQQGAGGFVEPLIIANMYDGTLVTPALTTADNARGGYAQIINGNPDQKFQIFGFAQNWLADRMIHSGMSANRIPAYRGYVTVGLFGDVGHFPDEDISGWELGPNPRLDSVGFIVTAMPLEGALTGIVVADGIGEVEANPIDVLVDILTGQFGKLGLDQNRLDMTSFTTAAQTCGQENNGYCRCIDTPTNASDLINDIMAQVDGFVYEDPDDQLLHVKLLRADYNYINIRTIDPTNCVELQQFQITSWADVPNRVVVRFTDRQNSFQSGVGVAMSQANAVGQDGEVREVVINMPGVSRQEQADEIASRELQSRSRPLMKCRAIVTREFADVKPGDPLNVVWPEANIGGIVFRVVNATRGTLKDGKISINLVQDYFYQRRHRNPEPTSHVALGSTILFGG